MRISLSVLRWLSAGILVITLLLLAASPALADTGAYEIQDYIVTIQPQEDGRVLMVIDQLWHVLSGSIPWVTIGLPNRNFEIKDFSGRVARVSDGSGGGFYGVRVDLTEDFQPGSVFNIRVVVLQSGLLERRTKENLWRIDYTPGWYDRAAIGRLQVNLLSPVSYESYLTADPMPSVKDNVLTWERANVKPGGRLDIRVESADGSFLTSVAPSNVKTGGAQLNKGFFIALGVIVVIGLLIFWRVRQGRKERDEYLKRRATAIEEEMAKDPVKKEAVEKDFKEYVDKKNLQPDARGRYYDPSYGSYMTPWIWMAIISSQYRHTAAPPPVSHPPSNSGFRSGCVSCACVSCACACACACAGGGAAGCSRKTLHECRICRAKEKELKAPADISS